MKTIAIIGGGFSGTIAAVNLARFAKSPLRVLIINSGQPTGRGTAYGTRRVEHLLNVAARNMSAFPDHPSHFVDWLQTRGEYAHVPLQNLREMFVPRRVYGDYLQGIFLTYHRPLDGNAGVAIELIEGEAVDLLVSDAARPVVVLSNGDSIGADQILLATGNQPPASIATGEGAFAPARYCPNPWSDWEAQLPHPNEDVILLGTGLTMVDVFLTLAARGWKGTITAVSRHGMVPRAHFRGIDYPDYVKEFDKTELSALVKLVSAHCRNLQAMGENTAIAIDKLRPHTQRLWKSLSTEEKRLFINRYAAKWNVLRHRIAAPIHEQLSAAISSGKLRLLKGTIVGIEAHGDRIVVNLRRPSGEEFQTSGAFVINCTGPQSSFSTSPVPLFQNLLRRGLVCPDDLDMGIDVSDDLAVIDSAGIPSNVLYAMGPLLKGTLWETTVIPELRGQAMRVAQSMLDSHSTLAMPEEAVIEYFI